MTPHKAIAHLHTLLPLEQADYLDYLKGTYPEVYYTLID